MSKAQRDKGLRGELEVRHLFENAGFEVRNLEGQGDNLVICSDTLTLHLEVKRQERIQIEMWSKQAESESPPGALPVVVYRRSRAPWRASLPLDALLLLLVSSGLIGPDAGGLSSWDRTPSAHHMTDHSGGSDGT